MKPPDIRRVKLTDFEGHSPRVSVTRTPNDPADVDATNMLIQQYTQADGFHCPVCGVVIKDREEVVSHLAEEINKTMERLGKR
jgi:predicted RNA-binding Zn-ribbon protein involved in translation (DUF1610 family)